MRKKEEKKEEVGRRLEAKDDPFSPQNSRGAFAVYQRPTSKQDATLDIPALKLKLNLKKFKSMAVTDVTKEEETRRIRDTDMCPADKLLLTVAKKIERNKEWNYD